MGIKLKHKTCFTTSPWLSGNPSESQSWHPGFESHSMHIFLLANLEREFPLSPLKITIRFLTSILTTRGSFFTDLTK